MSSGLIAFMSSGRFSVSVPDAPSGPSPSIFSVFSSGGSMGAEAYP